MTETEKKALALLQDCGFHGRYIDRKWNENYEALCRAIEQHEAFRQEVSDAVEAVFAGYHDAPIPWVVMRRKLEPFIVAKPDPLVEAWLEAFPGNHIDDARGECAKINAALAARGLEIREKQP